MSSPISSVHTPHASTPNAMKATPLSKKRNHNHVSSPFENGYLIRSLLPSPYNKSLVSALSSTSCSTCSILLHSTPQSVRDQCKNQNLSTPQSQVKNPFEIALINQLSNSIVSPGIFNTATPKSSTKNFEWTIDQLATLHPVEIDEKPHYKCTYNYSLEKQAQEAINQYFNSRLVVLSPIEVSDKNEKAVQNENGKTRKSVSASSQTALTLPPDFNMDLLGQYMTYDEKKNDNESSQSESFSTACLRRKLFCQEFQESDSSSLGSNRAGSAESLNEDVPGPIPSTPDWDRSASGNPLSSSPVIHRNRRYKSHIAGSALDCSGTVLSPIHHSSSPLSIRSQSSFRRHSLGSVEDVGKCLFSPCVSPINLESQSSEMASLNISDDVHMESCMKTPVCSPYRNHSEKTKSCLKASCIKEMSPLGPSVQTELVSSSKVDSNNIAPSEQSMAQTEATCLQSEVHKHNPSPSPNCTPQEIAKIPSNEAALFCNKKVPEAEPKSGISMDFSEMTSVLSTSNNVSMMPSKFEMTNVDSLQSVSTTQQDTGYMSYYMGSLPSRSEIFQASKSGFMCTSSLQDTVDIDKCITDQPSHSKPNHSSVMKSKLCVEKTVADKSHLDYVSVVERAHKMLNLTPNRDRHYFETHKKLTSNDTSSFQWHHPLGASTPSHKVLFKPASETAAEIIKKAQEDLSQVL